MERIQAAIAKARAARKGGVAERPQVSSDAPSLIRNGALAAPADTRDVWSALPEHKVEKALMDRNRILQSGKNSEVAAFDVMRTRTLKLMQSNGWTRVALTSPTAACGKSTVAINLGLSISRRDDLSAILVEADMRRPSLAKKLGIKARHSGARVLRGKAAFDKNAIRIAERMAVLTNAESERNASDLLQSPVVGEVLDDLQRTYDPSVMLFDMPPLQANDDTIGFLPFVDCVILVAAAEHTTIQEIDACERELAEHTNVLGIVLNKCHFAGRKYGYDYY